MQLVWIGIKATKCWAVMIALLICSRDRCARHSFDTEVAHCIEIEVQGLGPVRAGWLRVIVIQMVYYVTDIRGSRVCACDSCCRISIVHFLRAHSYQLFADDFHTATLSRARSTYTALRRSLICTIRRLPTGARLLTAAVMLCCCQGLQASPMTILELDTACWGDRTRILLRQV